MEVLSAVGEMTAFAVGCMIIAAAGRFGWLVAGDLARYFVYKIRPLKPMTMGTGSFVGEDNEEVRVRWIKDDLGRLLFIERINK